MAPIQLTLYDENDEPIKTCSREKLRWELLKKSVRLAKIADKAADMTEEDVDAIGHFIAEVFEGQMTFEEFNAHADIGEALAVIKGIAVRTSALVEANPTQPPSAAGKKRNRAAS